MFSMAMWMAVVVAPIQILAGDQHGLNTLRVPAGEDRGLEGDWETTPGKPLILFGMPNMRPRATDWAVEIPHLGALILTHSWNGSIKGLKDFPPQDRPPSPVVFWAFRIMVGLGVLMAARRPVGCLAAHSRAALRRRAGCRRVDAGDGAVRVHRTAGRLDRHRGRPPAVHGLWSAAHRRQRIADRAARRRRRRSPAFVVVYLIVFGAGFVFLLRLMRRPPTVGESGPPAGMPIRSAGITPAAALH